MASMRTVIKVWMSLALLAWACSSDEREDDAGNANPNDSEVTPNPNQGTIVGAIQ